MAHLVAIPKLGLTMTDCTLVDWAKQDGDRVEQGETLYAVETDKITSDIEADDSGYLRRFAEVDTMHEVGAVVGGLFATREEALAASGPGAKAPPGPRDEPAEPAAASASMPTPPPGKAGRVRVSPLARRIASAAGIDPASLEGSGAHGAVLRRDVDTEIARRESSARATAQPAAASAQPAAADTRRALAGMRKAIAQKMVQSLTSTAQMTGFARVDMAEAVRLRQACIAAEADLGVRVSYTDIVLKACAQALASMPQINASIIGDEIITWADVNVGLAVALDDGLIVPVIRNADRKSIAEIAAERIDLAARARSGRLSREDLDGGTFSLSNFGSYGGDFETPILNAPQSALLGIGAIEDEPVVRDGQIVIRPMMMLSLTFDHRLIDGAVAGRFRGRVREILENPYSMMATLR
ncbi:dihydrolipoamide acetyltransferase family protein [Arvimicrobium flavum]|uniref:dihydrolipoamide acetyltransferase family protein n=1 Tax=Arvimicrobium flavum TaxID=3393320 RepID=UPI00237C109F|nr:dihydrolipoamide acetyltransferase family protein [Mesorhizobium shangrilense]